MVQPNSPLYSTRASPSRMDDGLVVDEEVFHDEPAPSSEPQHLQDVQFAEPDRTSNRRQQQPTLFSSQRRMRAAAKERSRAVDDNESDDEDMRPGAYHGTTRRDMSDRAPSFSVLRLLVLLQPRELSRRFSSRVGGRNAEAQEQSRTPEEFHDEDEPDIVTTKRRRNYTLIVVLLLLGSGLLALVIMFLAQTADSHAQQSSPAQPQDEPDPNCQLSMDTIWNVCDNATTISETVLIPNCARRRYAGLKRIFLPTLMSDSLLPTSASCDPTNLALIALATADARLPMEAGELDNYFLLATFFFATLGNRWFSAFTSSSPWIPTTNIPPCLWAGVTCSEIVRGEINVLNLRDANIQGTLPSELGLLSTLREYIYVQQFIIFAARSFASF